MIWNIASVFWFFFGCIFVITMWFLSERLVNKYEDKVLNELFGILSIYDTSLTEIHEKYKSILKEIDEFFNGKEKTIIIDKNKSDEIIKKLEKCKREMEIVHSNYKYSIKKIENIFRNKS